MTTLPAQAGCRGRHVRGARTGAQLDKSAEHRNSSPPMRRYNSVPDTYAFPPIDTAIAIDSAVKDG